MSEKGEITFRGVAASGGICRGRVFVLGTRHLHVPHRVITQGEITEELKRLEQSIVATRKHSSLDGWRMVVCQPIDLEGENDGTPIIAIDPYGAGMHQRVVVVGYCQPLPQLLGVNRVRHRAAWSSATARLGHTPRLGLVV